MRNRNNRNTLAQINITNLVDIALTLVIILLMIAPMIEQGIEVNLPKTSPYEMKIEKSIIITVAPDNQYFIGGERMSLEEVCSYLKERIKDREISLIIKGDRKVPYENVIKVLDIAKKCKIDLIGLATQSE